MIVTVRSDNGKGAASAVEVQINARVRVPRGYTLRKEVIAEAIRFQAEHGRSPNPNIELRIIRWRHPDSDDPRWKDRGAGAAWETFRGLLQRARLDA